MIRLFTKAATHLKRLPSRLFVFTLVPVLVPAFLLLVLSNTLFQQRLLQDIERSTKAHLALFEDHIDDILSHSYTIHTAMATSAQIRITLRDILQNPLRSMTYRQLQTLRTIQSFINSMANSTPFIDSIYVYFENQFDQFLMSEGGILPVSAHWDTSWLSSYTKESALKATWSEVRYVARHGAGRDTTYVTHYRNVFQGQRRIGLIAINIHRHKLNTILDETIVMTGQHVVIHNEDGHPVFLTSFAERAGMLDSPDSAARDGAFFLEAIHGREYFVSVGESQRDLWRYYSYVPVDIALGPMNQTRNAVRISFALSLIIGFALSGYLSKQLYEQFHQITLIIERAQSGQQLPPTPPKKGDEYGYVVNGIVRSFVEKDYLSWKIEANEYRMKYMERIALQSQINPHFLFNTLEMINWKAIGLVGRPNEVNYIIEKLSSILKYVLQDVEKPTTIGAELHYTRQYLEIMNSRYAGRILVSWDYDQAVLDCPCCRMVLQPIVENCVHHGLRAGEDSRSIRIHATRAETDVIITVTDDGCGMSRQAVAQIRADMELPNSPEGIGLYSTNRRLNLAYGQAYGLRIESEIDIGTRITMTIPFSE